MHRSILYTQEQGRSFDQLWAWKDILNALGTLEVGMAGATTTVLSGLQATPTGPATLNINIANGAIYQQASMDTTSYGSLASDATTIQQQGLAVAQQVSLVTTGLGAGQSRYALIQAQFSQTDIIRAGDPNGGIYYFWNSANPNTPFQGPGNTGTTLPSVRQGLCIIQVIYGNVATTGSEVPPNPTAGWVPMYLVDLVFGQTQITAPQIFVAGPSVNTGVPSNYPGAPFVAGLLNQHHKGIAGQAPKIDLTAEVQNILPLANTKCSSAVAGGMLSTIYEWAGNPNTHVAGVAATGSSSPDLVWDTTNLKFWVCTQTGNTATAIWQDMVGLAVSQVAGASSKLTATLAAAGSTITVTADQITVAQALGKSGITLASYSQALNITTVGAGGMDVGTATPSSFVSIYAIYNPVAQTTSILAVNAATSSGAIYSGTHMPAGYTMSALLAIWPTNATPNLVAGQLIDRWFNYAAPIQVLSGGVATTLTGVSLSTTVPAVARSVNMLLVGLDSASITANSLSQLGATTIAGAYQLQISYPVTGAQSNVIGIVPIFTSQTIYYRSGLATVTTGAVVIAYSW